MPHHHWPWLLPDLPESREPPCHQQRPLPAMLPMLPSPHPCSAASTAAPLRPPAPLPTSLPLRMVRCCPAHLEQRVDLLHAGAACHLEHAVGDGGIEQRHPHSQPVQLALQLWGTGNEGWGTGWGGGGRHELHAVMACAAYQVHPVEAGNQAVMGRAGWSTRIATNAEPPPPLLHDSCPAGKRRLPGKMRAMAVAEPVLVGARLSIALRARRRSLFLLLGASITV